MKTRLLTYLAAAVAAVFMAAAPFAASAQQHGRMNPREAAEASRHARKAARNIAIEQVPRLRPGMMPSRHSFSPRPFRAVAPGLPSRVTAAQSGRIYGGAIFADTWTSDYQPVGIYSFEKTDGSTLAPEILGDEYVVTGGGAYANGKYYFVSYMQFMGMILANLYTVDFETWGVVNNIGIQPGSVAQDMEYDPTTGNAYGCFMNDDADGWVFGYMNLETGQRTALKDLDIIILTVGVTQQGEVYGIGMDGMLYKFDKRTGDRTAIGDTGRRPQYSASGCIDPVTGVFYWECMEVDAKARLYTVDLATGAATYVTDIDQNMEMTGMFIPAPEAADDAPAAVSDLAFSFAGTSLSGAVDFTMPSRTFGSGQPLSGALSYTMTVNEEEKATGTAQPGQSVSLPLTVPAAGEYRVTVRVGNSAGLSPLVQITGWIGNDMASEPQNVKLKRNHADGTMTLTWEAPEGTAHGGYFDPAQVTYKIERLPGRTVVAENLAATSFSETVPDTETFSLCSYYVTPFFDGVEGYTAESNKVGVGMRTLPYSNPVSDQAGFDELIVEDTNGDGETWTFDEIHTMARCRYSAADNYTMPMDDWLFSPPVVLKPGRMYRIAADVNNYYLASERAELGFGPQPEGASMTVVSDRYTLKSANPVTIEALVKVETEGKYYMGVHGCSPADCLYLYAGNFAISEGPLLGTPGAVTDLSITPGAQGALEATLSFKAPTTTVEGGSLASVTAVDIYRNGEKVTSLTSVTPGQQLKYVDKGARQSDNLYRIVARNDKGDGYAVERNVYVGHDRPGEPVNIRATEQDGSVVLTWDAPVKSETGGYFDPSSLLYTVVRGNDEAELAVDLTSRTFTDANPPLGGFRQEFFQYWVYAKSPAGYGYGASSNIVTVGEVYPLPYIETFPDGKISRGPWDVRMPEDSEGNWGIYHEGSSPAVTPYDADGGMVGYSPGNDGSEGTLVSPKFSLEGCTDPTVQFYYYDHQMESASIQVLAQANDGELKNVGTASLNTGSSAGWKKASFDLSEFAGEKGVQIAFKAVSPEGMGIIYVDNISVRQSFDYNLTAGALEAPQRMMAGEPSQVRVTVENTGRKTAKDFSIELYRNGTLEQTLAGTTTLPDGSRTYVFDVTPLNIWPDKIEWQAKVVYDKDLYEADNMTAVKTTTLTRPNYPIVNDLTGKELPGNTVELSWSEPTVGSAGGEQTLEDVEDYTQFSIDNFGDWTVRDTDGSATYGISDNMGGVLQYPNASMPMAFMAFNPSAVNINTTNADGSDNGWAPHSGYQMFACFSATSGKNDDWLISPLLPGIEQEVSFFVKSVTSQYGFEKYEVYYSTTGIEKGDFKRIGDLRSAPVAWTQEKVTLPEGTRYFAIRCVSEDCYVFLVDDIRFYASSAYTGELSLVGYNVYRDDTRLTAEPVMEQQYTDAIDEAMHKYAVTVVYDKGESAYSNIWTAHDSGLDGIAADGVKVSATTGAVIVEGAAGRTVRIAATDGRTVSSFIGTDRDEVPLTAGIYMVTVGRRTHKVIVK